MQTRRNKPLTWRQLCVRKRRKNRKRLEERNDASRSMWIPLSFTGKMTSFTPKNNQWEVINGNVGLLLLSQPLWQELSHDLKAYIFKWRAFPPLKVTDVNVKPQKGCEVLLKPNRPAPQCNNQKKSRKAGECFWMKPSQEWFQSLKPPTCCFYRVTLMNQAKYNVYMMLLCPFQQL